MKILMRKLRAKAGESLVESLAAILIFTMASIILFSMVTTAADINTKAKEQDALNQQYLIGVEKGENKTGAGFVSITMVDAAGNTKSVASVNVDVYGGVDEAQNYDADALYSFFVTEPTGG